MLDAHENELVQRMLKRGEETGRKDDTEETIRHRLRVYETQTEPVKTYYEARRTVEMINGLGAVEEITGRITKQLESPAA
jgi:adenylate kinase